MAEEVGGIVYEVGMEVSGLTAGAKQAEDALDSIDKSAQNSSKSMDKLDGAASSSGKELSALAKIVSSIDATLKDMASSSKTAASSVEATTSSVTGAEQVIAALNQQLAQMQQAQVSANATGLALQNSVNQVTQAIRALGAQSTETGGSISGIDRMIESLGNQIAILDEQAEKGARSAAILAAQLRAGDSATDAQKAKIAELTGRLYDMKNGTEAAGKSTGNFKNIMQQGGYQIQDFIVQVQGGQSALVAFSQQGSQLAGAFGPAGAVFGAVLALSTVIAGTFIASLNGGKSAIESLKDAADAMDKVITVSSSGVAALSDKYANLARVNAAAATILRNQAAIEYNAAIAKLPKAISDAADSFIGFGDKAISALSGGYASVDGFNDRLKSLNITTSDYSTAMKEAYGAGTAFRATADSIGNTVGAVASKLGISEEAAFGLTKQLADLSDNPSPQALQTLVIRIGEIINSSKNAKPELIELYNKLVDLSTGASNAAFNFELLKTSTDNLTAGQKSLVKQSERNLALSKLQGAARAKLQAQYAAEDAGLSKDDPITKKMMDQAAASYTNTEALKKNKKEQSAAAKMAESNAQKIQKLKQEAELSAESTNEMSRAQAILNAQQSLNKGATQEEIKLAGEYAAKKWDNVNALKAEAAARKLSPETSENASYQQDMKDLKTALDGKRITQQQYNQISEQLEQQHQVKMAQIRANESVTPAMEAAGQVNPVQALVNEQTKKLALIKQYEMAGVIAHTDAIALMKAADTQYQTELINAQWQIWSQQTAATQAAAAAFDAFGQTASNALTGVLTGSMSVSEALQSIGSNVLNAVINSFVQMGVEWLKSVIMGQVGMTAASAMAATQAQLIAAAMAPAAAMTSLATAGANAIPAQAGIVSTVGVAKAMSVAGALRNGGPAQAGSMYRVGENNLPEIFQASNGNQYMIPGDSGKVISNKDLTGSGGSGVVIYNSVVNNSSQATATTTATDNGDGSVTIETIVADIENGGPISQAITSNTTATRRATE
nr:MAG TPA: tail length tape measure protein [Caudoviricetes sp.]